MKADETLDIRSLASPFCLLMYKATLDSMRPGAVLEVHVRDPESIRDLLKILDRSGDKIMAKMQSEDCTSMWILKGPVEGARCLFGPWKVNHS
jgi:TusA-related sulfurtransferase